MSHFSGTTYKLKVLLDGVTSDVALLDYPRRGDDGAYRFVGDTTGAFEGTLGYPLFTSDGELNVTVTAGGVVSWTPLSLFQAAEVGAWYDPSDLSSVWEDAARTIPATVGNPVGCLDDKSGNGNNATQATTSSKPILRLSGGLYYLEFDGFDDRLATATINFTATDEVTVAAGAYKTSDAAVGVLVELSNNSTVNTGSWLLTAPQTIATANYRFISKGTIAANATAAGFAAGQPDVLVGLGKISTDSNTLRIDGVAAATAVSDQGTGTFGNYPINIGRKGISTVPFNGRLYGLVIRSLLTSGTDLTDLETYIAGKTGVTL